MLSRLLFLALVSCALPSTAGAEEVPITVAVLDIRAHGVAGRVAEALLDVVTEEVARAPRVKVLSRKEMERLLGEEAKKQLMGCDETSCLAEIAGALNAELLVSGELARLDESTLLTLQLINNRFATVMNRVSINWPGNPDHLPDVAQAASQLLVLERTQRKPGAIKLESVPSGADVFLDEKPVSARKLDGLDVGLHLVRVSASGYEERTIPVIVKTGATSRVNGSLTKIPLYKRPLFWSVGVLGTGLAGALVAGCLFGVPLLLLVVNNGGATVTGHAAVPETGVSP